MKKTLLACLIASTSFSASADFLLGGDIEVNAWQQNQTFRGKWTVQEDDTIAYTFEASLEHFIPLVPNGKIGRSSVEGDYYEYTKTDATLYYEFFDNDLISIDAGVGLTQLTDGSVTIGLVVTQVKSLVVLFLIFMLLLKWVFLSLHFLFMPKERVLAMLIMKC